MDIIIHMALPDGQHSGNFKSMTQEAMTILENDVALNHAIYIALNLLRSIEH